MKSIPNGLSGEPETIRGYYCEPTAAGTHPAIITFNGYDSDSTSTPWCPNGNDNPEWAEFVLSTRGQVINNRPPYENTYGDWFAYNFGDKDSYYYRGAYMDAVRALDFVASREKVDSKNIFAQGQSQGGAFTLACAALGGGRLRAIAPAIPFMGDFPDYFQVGSWPASVAFANQGTMSDDEMYDFLSYFDTKNLATKITCPTILTLGLQDNVCPPHTNIAPYNNLASERKEYSVNPMLKHEVPAEWFNKYMQFFRDHMDKGINATAPAVESDGIELRIDGENVTIYGKEAGETVTVFNAWGLAVVGTAAESFSLPTSGLYLVKVGTRPARKIIAG